MHTEDKHVLPWCWVLMRALPRAVSLTKSLPLWLMSGRRKTRSKTKSDGDRAMKKEMQRGTEGGWWSCSLSWLTWLGTYFLPSSFLLRKLDPL